MQEAERVRSNCSVYGAGRRSHGALTRHHITHENIESLEGTTVLMLHKRPPPPIALASLTCERRQRVGSLSSTELQKHRQHVGLSAVRSCEQLQHIEGSGCLAKSSSRRSVSGVSVPNGHVTSTSSRLHKLHRATLQAHELRYLSSSNLLLTASSASTSGASEGIAMELLVTRLLTKRLRRVMGLDLDRPLIDCQVSIAYMSLV